jgi:hypothetical protein
MAAARASMRDKPVPITINNDANPILTTSFMNSSYALVLCLTQP